jgi:hypothetical protein
VGGERELRKLGEDGLTSTLNQCLPTSFLRHFLQVVCLPRSKLPASWRLRRSGQQGRGEKEEQEQEKEEEEEKEAEEDIRGWHTRLESDVEWARGGTTLYALVKHSQLGGKVGGKALAL